MVCLGALVCNTERRGVGVECRCMEVTAPRAPKGCPVWLITCCAGGSARVLARYAPQLYLLMHCTVRAG